METKASSRLQIDGFTLELNHNNTQSYMENLASEVNMRIQAMRAQGRRCDNRWVHLATLLMLVEEIRQKEKEIQDLEDRLQLQMQQGRGTEQTFDAEEQADQKLLEAQFSVEDFLQVHQEVKQKGKSKKHFFTDSNQELKPPLTSWEEQQMEIRIYPSQGPGNSLRDCQLTLWPYLKEMQVQHPMIQRDQERKKYAATRKRSKKNTFGRT